MLKRLVEVTFSPLGILTISLGVGFVLSTIRRRSVWGRRLLIAGAFLFVLLLFSPIAEILIRNLEADYAPLLAPDPKSGLASVVVLSGYGEDNPNTPVTSNLSEQTIACLVEGMRVYRRLPGSRMILSGGVLRDGDRPVAAMMADFVRQMGVPAADVVVEAKSQDTFENLFEVRRIVGPSKFVLVAAACDLRRAVAVARKLEMNPVPAPAAIWALQHYPPDTRQFLQALAASFAYPSLQRLSRIQWAYHEYLGYVWYRMTGRI